MMAHSINAVALYFRCHQRLRVKAGRSQRSRHDTTTFGKRGQWRVNLGTRTGSHWLELNSRLLVLISVKLIKAQLTKVGGVARSDLESYKESNLEIGLVCLNFGAVIFVAITPNYQ